MIHMIHTFPRKLEMSGKKADTVILRTYSHKLVAYISGAAVMMKRAVKGFIQVDWGEVCMFKLIGAKYVLVQDAYSWYTVSRVVNNV